LVGKLQVLVRANLWLPLSPCYHPVIALIYTYFGDLKQFMQEFTLPCRIILCKFTFNGVILVMDNKALGKRIRALRRLKRVTQQQLAQMINLSASQLSNIERGVKEPKPELLEKMAAALDIPREEFFGVYKSLKRYSLL
jgi:DNA-binding XRE family transcriptional regulator